MSARWPFASDLMCHIMAVGTNDEGEVVQLHRTISSSIRKQCAFAKWKQAFIQEHKKSDQRQARKQQNMINTTTRQPYDPGEMLENTIKQWEQTNMSIKAWRLWNGGKKQKLCNNSLKTEQSRHIYKCASVLWITPILFLEKKTAAAVFFETNYLFFYFCSELEVSFIIFLFVQYF